MQTDRSTRRVRVPDRRGIYYREGADGRRRYEITYIDTTGRQRWQTVDGGLRDAEAAREDVRTRIRRGERVAPSRKTVAELADAWLAAKRGTARASTVDRYDAVLRVHVLPAVGRLRAADVDEDHALELVARIRAAGLSAGTARKALVVLGGVLGHAARRGFIADNPLRRLERGERPAVERRQMRVLDRAELGALLDAAPDLYRPLLAAAALTGLRQGELLGLQWRDVDFDRGELRVRRQLGRDGSLARPKTEQAVRDVVLADQLAATLRDHRRCALAVGLASPEAFVFASAAGTPLHYRNVVRRGLDAAARGAGIRAEPRLRFHDLRHTFASLLIADGLNVVYVSRQLGHASPAITLQFYAHLFDRSEHDRRARAALDVPLGKRVESSGGNQRELRRVADAADSAQPRGPRE